MLELGEDEDLGWGAVGERTRDPPPILHAPPIREARERLCFARGSPGRGVGLH